MPEEQDNQIERREPGGISRRSETARRGSDAARFVGGLANRRTESDLPSTVSTNPTYEFALKWGTEGTDDGQFCHPNGITVAADGSVYVSDWANHRIQKFTSEGLFITKWGTHGKGDGQFTSPPSGIPHAQWIYAWARGYDFTWWCTSCQQWPGENHPDTCVRLGIWKLGERMARGQGHRDVQHHR